MNYEMTFKDHWKFAQEAIEFFVLHRAESAEVLTGMRQRKSKGKQTRSYKPQLFVLNAFQKTKVSNLVSRRAELLICPFITTAMSVSESADTRVVMAPHPSEYVYSSIASKWGAQPAGPPISRRPP